MFWKRKEPAFIEKEVRGQNMVQALYPWEIRENGLLVTSAGKEKKFHKSLVATISLIEPDSTLLDYLGRFQQTIIPLKSFFALEESVGTGQQLQILRYTKPCFSNPIVNKSIEVARKHGSLASRIQAEHTEQWQQEGHVPEVSTYALLNMELEGPWIKRSELKKKEKQLLKRAKDMVRAFAAAGYTCKLLTERQPVMNLLWEYFNPTRALTCPAPEPIGVPQHQFNDASLKHTPALAPDSLRKQLVTSPYEFRRDYVYGDNLYRAFLVLDSLPKRALSGFEELYKLDLDLVISQFWNMVGIRTIAQELEQVGVWADELRKDFGDRVANTKLEKDIENIEELRDNLTESDNLIKYKLMVCVRAKSVEELDEAVSKVEATVAGIDGATLYREKEVTRLKRCFLECGPGVPQLSVDYQDGKSHVLRTDRAAWFLPRYGVPKSDAYTPGIAHTLAWSTKGTLVRKNHWGATAGNIVVGVGLPGTGKSWNQKTICMQLAAHHEDSGVRIWTIDNNGPLTSFDFINRMNGGKIVRFSDDLAVSLPTFDILGDKPTSGERRYLVKSVWLDINGENAEAMPMAYGSVLSSAITCMYKVSTQPNYDDLVEILREWAQDQKYEQYRKELNLWATSLEQFCSGAYLSKIKEIPHHPDGDYYDFFGRKEGLRLAALEDVPMVSWNLEGLADEFLKKKVGLLLTKMMLSFGRLLGLRSSREGKPYSLEVLVDEGWETLNIDGGEFLNQINRRHRHIRTRLYFFTQQASDLTGEVGIVVLKNASHWMVFSTGQDTTEEAKSLGLSPVEIQRCSELKRVPGVYGEYLYRRKLDNSAIESHILLNVLPVSDKGSWLPAITGDRNECILREALLRQLGAESLLEASQEDCEIVFDVMGKIWPRGLPGSSDDTEKLSKDEGWAIAVKMLEEHQTRQKTRHFLDQEEEVIIGLLEAKKAKRKSFRKRNGPIGNQEARWSQIGEKAV